MKYMLLMSTPRDGYKQFMSSPKAVFEANIAFMQRFTQRLKGAGELWHGRPRIARTSPQGPRRQGRSAHHGRCVSGIQGVPGGLLDH